MTEASKCTHSRIRFQSGDHEIYCDLCPRMWNNVGGYHGESNQSPEQLALCDKRFTLSASSPAAEGAGERKAWQRVKQLTHAMIYRCGHPRGGCPEHCDLLVKMFDLACEQLATRTPSQPAPPSAMTRQEAQAIVDDCKGWNTGQRSISFAMRGERTEEDDIYDSRRAALKQAWAVLAQPQPAQERTEGENDDSI